MPGKKGMKGESLGGVRLNAGRKANRFIVERGETVVFERETIGVEIHKPQLWRVLSVSYDEIEFQCGNDILCGNDIFVIRKPDIEE